MSKTPAFMFYTGDWLKDPPLSMCSPATRGIWLDLLCAMHELGRCGQVTGAVDQLRRLCRCTSAEMNAALAELASTNTATVTTRNDVVTVVCRRMQREHKERVGANERVQKHRSNADETPKKHESNGASSSSDSIPVTKPKDSRRDGKPSKSPEVIWDLGVTMLVKSGWTEPNARSFLGKQAKDFGKTELAQAISATSAANPVNPHEYLVKTLQSSKPPHSQVGKPLDENYEPPSTPMLTTDEISKSLREPPRRDRTAEETQALLEGRVGAQ